jgi:hypothetical protein
LEEETKGGEYASGWMAEAFRTFVDIHLHPARFLMFAMFRVKLVDGEAGKSCILEQCRSVAWVTS